MDQESETKSVDVAEVAEAEEVDYTKPDEAVIEEVKVDEAIPEQAETVSEELTTVSPQPVA